MSLKDRLQKKGYFQGANEAPIAGKPGVTSNDPSKLGYPNEIKYDRLETTVGGDSRDWEQRWFENAAKDTKKVLGPAGKEFDLKKQLQRIPQDEKIANAKLSAQFTIKASPRASFWTVYATDNSGKKEPILTATLDQIFGNEMTEQDALDAKTPEYANEIIARMRNNGFAATAWEMTGDKNLEAIAKKNLLLVAKAEASKKNVKTAQEIPQTEEMPSEDLNATVDQAAEEDAKRSDATVVELEQKQVEIEAAEAKLVELLPEQAQPAAQELQEVESAIESAIEEHKEIAAQLRDKTISASMKVKIMRVAQEAFDQATIETLPSADEKVEDITKLVEDATQAITHVEEVVEELKPEGAVSEVGTGLAGEPVEAPVETPVEEKELTVAQIKSFFAKRAEIQKQAEEQKYQVTPDGAPKDGEGEIALAHPEGGHDVTNLTAGAPIANEGAKFETIVEQHKKDEDIANKTPKGELNSSAASKTQVKTAAADTETKEFWHQLWDQAGPEGKKFASELVGDYSEKKISAAIDEAKGKIKRAYQLADQAIDKGMYQSNDKEELVEKIAKFNDESFLAFKAAVDGIKINKIASQIVQQASLKVPQMGKNEKPLPEYDDFTNLDKLGWH